jgi:hypothetical protein
MKLTENPNTRVKSAMIGINPDVYSIGIITSDNPMSIHLSQKDNLKRREKFKQYLKDGRFEYIQLSYGMYGNKEKPFLIFNVTIEDLIKSGVLFEQESFIYGEKKTEGMVFYYYSQTGDGNFNLKDKSEKITSTSEADDFFTRQKDWKFNIPFSIFEGMEQLYLVDRAMLKEMIPKINDINKQLVFESSAKTGHWRYSKRGEIRGIINT